MTVLIGFLLILIVFVASSAALYFWKEEESKVGVIISVVVAVFLCAVLLFFQFGTERGKRLYKSQQSDFGDGIERRVTVYGMNGEIVTTYEGRFDVDYSKERVLFDDEDGNRHIIYFKTGSITVDEVSGDEKQ